VENPAENVGAPAIPPFQDDVDSKCFKRFQPASHGQTRIDVRTPALST
jgi:hypothetical protein